MREIVLLASDAEEVFSVASEGTLLALGDHRIPVSLVHYKRKLFYVPDDHLAILTQDIGHVSVRLVPLQYSEYRHEDPEPAVLMGLPVMALSEVLPEVVAEPES